MSESLLSIKLNQLKNEKNAPSFNELLLFRAE